MSIYKNAIRGAGMSLFFAIGLLSGVMAQAQTNQLNKAEEKVITKVFNNKNEVILEIKEKDISQYKEVKFKATTPWFPEQKEFKGFLFRDILKKAGFNEKDKLQVIAWDKFTVEFPAEDAFNADVILTTHIDGKRITLRDKGPLFIMYPMDTNPKFKDTVYYNRSAWQIKEIRQK